LAVLVRNFMATLTHQAKRLNRAEMTGNWGTDEDSHLTIPTEYSEQTLAEKRKKSAELRGERQAEQARRESDPAYQKRQADLKRYAELLQAVSGSVDNSWSNQMNFRIELENISPDQMEDLIAAIRKVRGEN